MNKHSLSIALILMILSTSAFAQKVRVQFALIPQTAELKIDGKPIQGYITNLEPGTHLLECWHPLFEYWVDTLIVPEGDLKPITYRKRLNVLPAYEVYRKDYSGWLKEKKKATRLGRVLGYTSIGLMGASGAAILPDYLNARSLRSDLQSLNENIANSFTVDEVADFVIQYNLTEEKFKASRARVRGLGFGVFLPASALLVGSHFIVKKQAKKIRPAPLFEPNEPFTQSRIRKPELSLQSNGLFTALKLNF